jgi:hypothetical protein
MVEAAALKPRALTARRATVRDLCYIDRMRPVRAFFFGYFWFSSAPGGREI